MFISLGEITVQVKIMTYLWVETTRLTANAHVIIQKYVRYLLNKFIHNNSLVVSPFIWSELRLSTFKNWNHPTYPRHNLFVIHLMKVIWIIAQLRYILTFSSVYSLKGLIALLLETIWYHMNVCAHQYRCTPINISTNIYCFIILYYHLLSSWITWTWQMFCWR